MLGSHGEQEFAELPSARVSQLGRRSSQGNRCRPRESGEVAHQAERKGASAQLTEFRAIKRAFNSFHYGLSVWDKSAW